MTDNPELFNARATAGTCGAMVAVGMMLAAYGPAIVEFEHQFGVSGAAAAAGLAVQSAGAVIGALVAQPVLRWRGNRFAMTAAMLLMAVGCLTIAAAPSWSMTLGGAVIAGFGLGGCDALGTQLFVFGQGHRGPMLVNVAHGCFGLGTVLAPVTLAFIGFDNYRAVFVLTAVISLCAAATMTGLDRFPTPADAPGGPAPSTPGRGAPVRLLVVGGFLALFVLHFGVQQGIGSWGPTRLLELGHSGTETSVIIAGYWMAMVLGRFATAPLANRLSPSKLVSASCAGMSAAIMLAMWEPATVWAYLLAGLFIGPIFPNGLNWLARTPYAKGSAFAYVIAGAMAGAAVFPLLIGEIIDGHGSSALAPALVLGSAAALLTCAANAFWLSRVPEADADAPSSGDGASPTPRAPNPGRRPPRRSRGARLDRSPGAHGCECVDPALPR